MCSDCAPKRRMTPGRVIARGLIGFYQGALSPLLGRQCRHLPTCSAYTLEAIESHGFWSGGWIGLARILRCNPWGSAGYDPIPMPRDPGYRWWRPWVGARWTGAHIDPELRPGG